MIDTLLAYDTNKGQKRPDYLHAVRSLDIVEKLLALAPSTLVNEPEAKEVVTPEKKGSKQEEKKSPVKTKFVLIPIDEFAGASNLHPIELSPTLNSSIIVGRDQQIPDQRLSRKQVELVVKSGYIQATCVRNQ